MGAKTFYGAAKKCLTHFSSSASLGSMLMEVEVLKSCNFIPDEQIVSSEISAMFSSSLHSCEKHENWYYYSRTFLCLLCIKPLRGFTAWWATSNHTAKREMVWALQETFLEAALQNSSWPTAESSVGLLAKIKVQFHWSLVLLPINEGKSNSPFTS